MKTNKVPSQCHRVKGFWSGGVKVVFGRLQREHQGEHSGIALGLNVHILSLAPHEGTSVSSSTEQIKAETKLMSPHR